MDRLEEIIYRLGWNNETNREDSKWLISKIEQLQEALKKYGHHVHIIERGSYKGICESLKHSEKICNCGFEQALKEK